MKQLAPPRHVFIYESHMIGVESRQEPSSKACYLLSVFFPNEELIGTNLTGANNKKALDSDIIGAIVGKISKDYCISV